MIPWTLTSNMKYVFKLFKKFDRLSLRVTIAFLNCTRITCRSENKLEFSIPIHLIAIKLHFSLCSNVLRAKCRRYSHRTSCSVTYCCRLVQCDLDIWKAVRLTWFHWKTLVKDDMFWAVTIKVICVVILWRLIARRFDLVNYKVTTASLR
jgi:hypothetical protein